MKRLKISEKLLLLALLAINNPCYAATGYLAPWLTFGIDSDRLTYNQGALKQLHEQIRDQYLEDAKAIESQQTLTQNAKISSKKFSQGTIKSIKDSVIHPILCLIDQQAFFMLQLTDLETGMISSLNIDSFSGESFLNRDNDQFSQQVQNILANNRELNGNIVGTAIKMQLSLKRSSQNSLLGQNHCLNILFTQALMKEYRTISPVGLQEVEFIRYLLQKKNNLSRANRVLKLDWRKELSQWKAYAELSEGVYGRLIRPGYSWSFQDPLPQAVPMPDQLKLDLTQDETALDPQQNPVVASIYGAWAYLDRGRAWGLKMKDRLYLVDGDKKIKGHIVAYFGPEQGLKSPLGFPIQEGAIMFVRTGQYKIRVGDTLSFDPTAFPAKWPPEPTP